MTREEEIGLLRKRLTELTSESEGGDALDHILRGSPRQTAATRIRMNPIMVQFREEVERGMVEAATARQVLGLLRTVLSEVGP